jgi:hypothetical protein
MLMCPLPHCHMLFIALPSPTKRCQRLQWKGNKLLRATWQAEYGDIPAEYFVWLDESSVDNHTNQCMNGWAVCICPCVHWAMFIWGQQYWVLLAITSKGYIALDIFEGSVNKERFIHFLEEQLVCAQDTIFHKYCRPTTHPISWTMECCSSWQLSYSSWQINTPDHCWRIQYVIFHNIIWTIYNSYCRC